MITDKIPYTDHDKKFDYTILEFDDEYRQTWNVTPNPSAPRYNVSERVRLDDSVSFPRWYFESLGMARLKRVENMTFGKYHPYDNLYVKSRADFLDWCFRTKGVTMPVYVSEDEFKLSFMTRSIGGMGEYLRASVPTQEDMQKDIEFFYG